jgi:hypothetical protein
MVVPLRTSLKKFQGITDRIALVLSLRSRGMMQARRSQVTSVVCQTADLEVFLKVKREKAKEEEKFKRCQI